MLLPLLIATAACAAAAAWLLRQREPTFHVEGRVVLITGAAQGIGKLLATMMAERGADLVLWDISGKSLQDAKAGMLARFPDRQIHTDVVDVCNAEAVEAAAARAHSFAGARGVSVLVNNAGAWCPLLQTCAHVRAREREARLTVELASQASCRDAPSRSWRTRRCSAHLM